MRFYDVDTIIFTNKDGVSFSIKDKRDIEINQTLIRIKINKGDRLDEIASREQIYGKNAESLSYKIFDHNIVKITESKFELGELKELNIPNLQ